MIARFKVLVRALVRWLVPIVSTRPWMVKLAARAFGRFPTLKLRLRRMVSQPVVAPAQTRNLDDAQMRVLIDLREAMQDRSRSGSGT